MDSTGTPAGPDEAGSVPGRPGPVLLVGLGNPLLSDEGVGVCVVQAVARQAERFPGVTVADLGTAGMRLLHLLPGYRKAVIVDCARMGLAPGAIRRFTPDQVRSLEVPPRLSVHEGDLLGVLDLSRRLGECPPVVVILGIEPADLSPGLALSPALTARLAEYLDLVQAELRAPNPNRQGAATGNTKHA